MGHSWSVCEFEYMRRALALSKRGKGRVEPNPLVGAVIVKNKGIIGEGYHQQYGGPHAEVNAIRDCTISPEGATIYVTLEPCHHHGKTPACTKALLDVGIKRVVVAMKDPHSMVSGKGFKALRDGGLEVLIGLCEKEAISLNAPYIKLKTNQIPYVTAKWAMTLDGRLASKSGDSKWITQEKARRHVHRQRNQVDAILVGIETVLKDNPLLTCRVPWGKIKNPIRIVLDSKARMPLDSKLIQTILEAELWLVTTSEAPPSRLNLLENAGCQIVKVRSKQGLCSLKDLLLKLGEKEITHLLVEGGHRVLTSFFKTKLVDQVQVYIGSKIVGNGISPINEFTEFTMPEALNLENIKIRRFDSDTLIEGILSW